MAKRAEKNQLEASAVENAGGVVEAMNEVPEALVEVLHDADVVTGDDADLAPGDTDDTRDDGGIADTEAYLKGLVEALLFVSDRPLELKEIARAARIDHKRTEELLAALREDYAGRGLAIEEIAGGYAFRSSTTYSGPVRNFLSQRPVRLSRAQLETLSIVAYRQPITRPEVDDIRGVDCGPVLKGLLERDLIRIIGKKDEPGRPMLYGTTTAFLELFSMHSLRDLPTLKEFTELSEESKRAFEHETGEEAPEGPLEVAEDDAPPAPAFGDEPAEEAPVTVDPAEAREDDARAEASVDDGDAEDDDDVDDDDDDDVDDDDDDDVDDDDDDDVDDDDDDVDDDDDDD